MPKATQKKSQSKQQSPAPDNKLLLTGKDIVDLGEEAELLVGGKNYNTAQISEVKGIKTPQFRAISSAAFHFFLDEARVDSALINKTVDKEYEKINWTGAEANADPDFLKHFVRNLGHSLLQRQGSNPGDKQIFLREFINQTVSGFAASQEDIDQLRKRSVLVQTAILSTVLPEKVQAVVAEAYRSICHEAGMDQVQVAVRSSAAGEDSKKKAFAGLQDTYLNITSEEDCIQAFQWDCASAYNLRSMTYRRESIRDAMIQAEQTQNPALAAEAHQEWGIENTSLSVCIMRMIEPVVSGTAFSADTATGCRGRGDNDLVSMDSSYGLGEAVVSGLVTPDKCYVFQREDGQEVGFCGQGVSNSTIIRGLVCVAGIVSASVVPDSYAQTKEDIHELEQENIPVSELGSWLQEKHLDRLIARLEQDRYGHILRQGSSPKALQEWYTGEVGRLHAKIKDSLGSPKEDFYRQELETFRSRFHKPVIYANWDWETTISDALHQAGFSSFEEQQAALKKQREALLTSFHRE